MSALLTTSVVSTGCIFAPAADCAEACQIMAIAVDTADNDDDLRSFCQWAQGQEPFQYHIKGCGQGRGFCKSHGVKVIVKRLMRVLQQAAY